MVLGDTDKLPWSSTCCPTVGLCHGRPKLPVELLWRPVEFMQDFRPLVVLRKELPQAGFFVCLLDPGFHIPHPPPDYTPMHFLFYIWLAQLLTFRCMNWTNPDSALRWTVSSQHFLKGQVERWLACCVLQHPYPAADRLVGHAEKEREKVSCGSHPRDFQSEPPPRDPRPQIWLEERLSCAVDLHLSVRSRTISSKTSTPPPQGA